MSMFGEVLKSANVCIHSLRPSLKPQLKHSFRTPSCRHRASLSPTIVETSLSSQSTMERKQSSSSGGKSDIQLFIIAAAAAGWFGGSGGKVPGLLTTVLHSDLVQMMTNVSLLRLRNVVIKRIGTAIRLAPGRGSPVFRLKLPQWS